MEIDFERHNTYIYVICWIFMQKLFPFSRKTIQQTYYTGWWQPSGVAVAYFEYLFKDIKSLITMGKQQPMILAGVLNLFAEIPPSNLSLFPFNLTILSVLQMLLVLVYGRSNTNLGSKQFLIFQMLRWLSHTDIIPFNL